MECLSVVVCIYTLLVVFAKCYDFGVVAGVVVVIAAAAAAVVVVDNVQHCEFVISYGV